MFKILIIANLLSLLCFLTVYSNEFTAFAEIPSINETLQQNTNQLLGEDEGQAAETFTESYDFIEDEELIDQEADATDFIDHESLSTDFIETEEDYEDLEVNPFLGTTDFIENQTTEESFYMEPLDFTEKEIREPASSIDSLEPLESADAEDFVEGTPMPPPPEDFLDPSSPQFQSTVYIIAEDLKNIGENEIKDYPLVSLKDEELKLIFNSLDPTTLTKVLMNIQVSDIQKIQEKITLPEYNKIVNKISETDRNQINSRVQ